jgi:hypothetical protein
MGIRIKVATSRIPWVAGSRLICLNAMKFWKNMTRKSPSVSVTRQACVALLGDSPRLPSDQVACSEYAVSWEGNEAYAPFVRELLEKQEFEAAYAKIAEAAPFSARETSRGVPAM